MKTQQLFLFLGSLFSGLSVAIGAFGAKNFHLSKILKGSETSSGLANCLPIF